MSSKTRQRLIEEAAKQFAERGIRAVSVRDVTQAAEANVASVSYHFDGQDGLIDAVLETYLIPVLAEREERYTSLPSQADLHQLLTAWIEPVLNAAKSSPLGEALFFELNLSALDDSRRIETLYSKRRAKICKSCDLLVACNVPGLAERTRRWRLHWALEMLERSLVRGVDLQCFIGRVAARLPLDELVEKLLDFAVAGIRAPVGMPDPARKAPKKPPTSTASSQDELSF